MSAPIISVRQLSKSYRLGDRAHFVGRGLRHAVSDWLATPFRRSPTAAPAAEASASPRGTEFWALQDVSFDVGEGEVVGIIGRNGAGKSTLLKILSRITYPTGGEVRLRGRIASLLEVGTGFHPELTGRENIYLNGSILGMTRAEVARKFDEIVAFSEIERFIDTPVKRYSSGMYVRLAFAVAAHLEPEILLIDEVLAVGDAEFQKKCLGKMGAVAKAGRTVLFVSHNMAAVENLCRRGIVLRQGVVHFMGSQTDAVAHYLTSISGEHISLRDRADRSGTGEVKVMAIEVRDEQGRALDVVKSGQTIDLWFHFENRSAQPLTRLLAGLLIRTPLDVPVFVQHNRLTGDDFGTLPARGAFVCRIPRLPLPPSTYKLTYSVMPNFGKDETYLDCIEAAATLTVVEGDFFGTGEVPPAAFGACLVEAKWRVEKG